MRQFFFSVMAILMAVSVYFALKPLLGLETVSWVCILAAVPFGAMGFIKYNGMTAEQFLVAWFRDRFIMPGKLLFGNTNVYWKLLMEQKRRKKNDKDTF